MPTFSDRGLIRGMSSGIRLFQFRDDVVFDPFSPVWSGVLSFPHECSSDPPASKSYISCTCGCCCNHSGCWHLVLPCAQILVRILSLSLPSSLARFSRPRPLLTRSASCVDRSRSALYTRNQQQLYSRALLITSAILLYHSYITSHSHILQDTYSWMPSCESLH